MNKNFLILSSAFALGITCPGTIILSDFNAPDFAEGELDGQGGWSVAGATGDHTVAAGGLTYTSGAVNHNGGSQHLNLSSASGAEPRASLGLGAESLDSAGTFYFSYLFEYGTQFNWIAFGDASANDNGSLGIAISSNNFQLRARDSAGGQTATNIAGANAGGTRLVVGKIDFNPAGSSTLSVSVDPDSRDEPAVWDQTASRTLNITDIDTLWIRKGGSGNPDNFDYILMGSTYDAVVIPEPKAWAFVFGAVAMLCLFIRRRRSV